MLRRAQDSEPHKPQPGWAARRKFRNGQLGTRHWLAKYGYEHRRCEGDGEMDVSHSLVHVLRRYPNATQPTVSRPFCARFAPFFRRSFVLSGFLAPRRRERAKNGGKWAKFGGETGEKQRWLSGVGDSSRDLRRHVRWHRRHNVELPNDRRPGRSDSRRCGYQGVVLPAQKATENVCRINRFIRHTLSVALLEKQGIQTFSKIPGQIHKARIIDPFG